jgi:hypothetical protein
MTASGEEALSWTRLQVNRSTDFDGPLRENPGLPGVSAASGVDDRAHDQDVLLHVVVDTERRTGQ